jgi:hypothetical protein
MRYTRSLALVVALGLSGAAHALGSLAAVTLVDRDSGLAIPTHYYRGEYWVAGTPGARYAIEIRNDGGGRVLAVTAVDGVNVVSGETAAYGQSGYVFAPGEGYQITGWRKSDAEVAAFEFTASPYSYAARTRRPANVGVIGVALFREAEVAPPVVALPQRLPFSPRAAPKPEPPPAPVDDAAGAAADPAESAGARAHHEAPMAAAVSPSLGTGHGSREASLAWHTVFKRRRAEPDEVIRIRYDSERNLVAMGILPRSRGPAPGPRPFPGEPGYVPDPPG